MKNPLLSYAIASVGLFVLVISWGQWFFKYPDTSQLFLGTMIALNIIAWGYTYAWMKRHDKLSDEWEGRFQGLVKMFTKGEFE